MGIRSFHEFEGTHSHTVMCRSVSSSIHSKEFQLNCNSDSRTIITRILDSRDFNNGTFLIVEKEDDFFLAQIISDDLKTDQVTVSIFSPSLPTKKISASKSAPIIIPTTNIIGRLVDSPTRTTTNNIKLSDAQFLAIQDLCDEF